ncbi:hypothetical protein K438DRAFT_1866303 [Mycena galopus ATCC 62051]|nr:hypothetical protein K438DRAFT_1866303 [Mycena galopus ATCC 62051]
MAIFSCAVRMQISSGDTGRRRVESSRSEAAKSGFEGMCVVCEGMSRTSLAIVLFCSSLPASRDCKSICLDRCFLRLVIIDRTGLRLREGRRRWIPVSINRADSAAHGFLRMDVAVREREARRCGDRRCATVGWNSSGFGSKNCDPGVRPWTKVVTLFASPMTNVWSDGLAFSCFIGGTPIRDGHPLRGQHHHDH